MDWIDLAEDMFTCTGGYVQLYRNVGNRLYRGNSEVLLRIQASRDAVSFGTFRRGVVLPATESCSRSNCSWPAGPCKWGSGRSLALLSQTPYFTCK